MAIIQDALALESKGLRDDAVKKLSRWLDSKGKKPPKEARLASFHIARMLLQLGRPGDASAHLSKALTLYKKDAELLNLSGIAAKRQGQWNEALGFFDAALKADKTAIAALANKTLLLVELKRSDEAIDSALALKNADPKNSAAERFIGNALLQKGQLQDAIRHFDAALALQPKDVVTWIDRIKADTDFERHEEAIKIVEAAVKELPTEHRLIEARIMVYRRAGRFKEAEDYLLRHLEEKPDDDWAHFQLAETVARFDRERGNKHYLRAVELKPDNAIYWMNYANSLDRSRYGVEADHIQAGYEAVMKALTLGPLPSRFIRMARNILVRMGRFDIVKTLGSFRDLGRTWAHESLHDALHYHLARVETDEDRYEILEQHRIWGNIELAKTKLNPLPKPALVQGRDKIRLGIMSSDLRHHPVSYFAMPLFDYIDRNKFEVYCYSWCRHDPDPIQNYIASRVDQFRWHKAIADRDAAELIANDRLDMLFELGSSTDMNKLEVMAWNPAPLTASWLGYPHSAGLESIDYILVDPFINPPDPALLIERPFEMPKSWVAMGRLGFNEAEEIIPVIPSARKGYVTFGTANNPYKYSPKVLSTWARVLKEVPESKFLFVRPEAGAAAFREFMTKAFVDEGVAADRILFESIRGKHMRYYNEMDISLDTFPQTGGTTTCESIFMGVPVITLVGTAFFERLSYSNLSNAGLGDLAAFTFDDYVKKAVTLAQDTKRRTYLRSALRRQIKERPLGQPELFARDFYDLVAKTVREAR
jgi:predicted O-linked N-acetylglucosamine transferase (SPINDLY family)